MIACGLETLGLRAVVGFDFRGTLRLREEKDTACVEMREGWVESVDAFLAGDVTVAVVFRPGDGELNDCVSETRRVLNAV